MARASPISLQATLLRQSVFASPSDRFRGGPRRTVAAGATPLATSPRADADAAIQRCSKALRDLPAFAVNFFAHKRRYGAGVSTSGSQPENPGSIPGTATKQIG